MARLASEAKGGFYATPVAEMELVLQAMQVDLATASEEQIFIYDPCCGEGEALRMIAEKLRSFQANVRTYGAEIEADRAQAASEVLDNVIHDAYQHVRVEPFGMSLLWLNPPYQQDVDGKRAELHFLKALTDLRKGVLQKGGVLLFCIPQHVLVDTAGILAGRFSDISVYRFTDDHFDVFKQVVVVARFERAAVKTQKDQYNQLVQLGKIDPTFLPTLAEMKEFTIPASSTGKTPYFRANAAKVEELIEDMKTSMLFSEISAKLVPQTQKIQMKRPLLPLKPAHAGIALAAGAVGGNLGTHIVSGVTKPRTDVETMYDAEGNRTGERRTLHFTSIVRAFSNEYGVVDLK